MPTLKDWQTFWKMAVQITTALKPSFTKANPVVHCKLADEINIEIL